MSKSSKRKAKEAKHSVGESKPNSYVPLYFKDLPDDRMAEAVAKLICMNANSGSTWVTVQNVIAMGLRRISSDNPESRWFLDRMVDTVLDEVWNKAYSSIYFNTHDEKKSLKEADRIRTDFLGNLEAV